MITSVAKHADTTVTYRQTLLPTEGKGLGHSHRATCRPGI